MKEKLNYLYIFLPIPIVLFGLLVLKNAFLTILFYHIFMISVLVINKAPINFKDFFKGWDTKWGLLLIIGGLSTGFIALLFWNLIFLTDIPFTTQLEKIGLSKSNWFLFLLYFSVINPVIEEVFWRGYFRDKNIRFNLECVGFASYHLFVLYFFVKIYWLPVVFIFLFIASIFWKIIYKKYEGLLVPLISHVLADLSIVFAVTVVLFGLLSKI
ncbi:MAG TPA: CPBP family intramembrane metalloprotease [Spirochaetota bacterium]|nr:CPBP family intramembrane metalloprotease [Spirochaetota bacterium]